MELRKANAQEAESCYQRIEGAQTIDSVELERRADAKRRLRELCRPNDILAHMTIEEEKAAAHERFEEEL